MRKNLRYIGVFLLIAGLLTTGVAAVSHGQAAVLSPAGTIASQQRDLLVAATLLMLLIVLPVFGLTFFIAWKYRASNTKADYQPEWDHNLKLETLWWGLPCAIILVLAIMAWNTSHSLDPSRPIRSSKAPVTIQVIALQWKWLFIYPEQQIATLNYVQFPSGRPVNFEITADAPMNSFWIPKLGGQIYAMSGMTTHLHLMADKPGTYYGSSANLSGEGFAAMHFTAQSSSDADFAKWASTVRQSPNQLSLSAYTALSRPNVARTNNEYAAYEPDLYNTVVMKYMAPQFPADQPSTQPAAVIEHSHGLSHE